MSSVTSIDTPPALSMFDAAIAIACSIGIPRSTIADAMLLCIAVYMALRTLVATVLVKLSS